MYYTVSFFLQIWRICADWNEYRDKIDVFLMILRYQSLKSLLVYKYLLLSRFLGKNRKNTVVFVCCGPCFVFFLGYKAAFVEILSMKTGLMHASVGRSTLRGIPLLCWWLICGAVSSLLRCVGWFLDRGMHLRLL